MNETSSAARRFAADSIKAERRRLTLVTGGILLALAAAVAFLRLYRLSEFPPGVDAGEGANGLDALRVLQGEHAVFFPEKFNGREGMVMYAIALSISLFGRTEFALRLPTALASAGTVFVVFWLGQVLFGRDEESGQPTPWRGLLIGGTAAGLMAVSLSLTIMGRTAFRTSLLPLFLCLCLAFLWQGWTQRERASETWWPLALAGICAGLLPYTYLAARFVPFLFLFFGLSFLLPTRPANTEVRDAAPQLTGFAAALHRARAELPRVILFVGVASLVAAPILIHFALNPDHFFSRSRYISVFHPSKSQGDPLGAFLVNLWDHLLVFGFRGDPAWRHNFADRTMLNSAEALFFWLGVGTAVWRWQVQPAYRLLLLWLSIMILPAALAMDGGTPSFQRMIGAAPAVYLLLGVGIWEAIRFLKERFFADKRALASIAAGSAVCSLVLFQGVITYRAYFQLWAVDPETYREYQVNWAELARMLDVEPAAEDTIYLIPGYAWYYHSYWQDAFGYLYQGTAPTRMISVGAYNLAPAVESALAEMENVSTVKFVDWDNELAGGDPVWDEQIIELLGKYGAYQGSEEGASFRIHNYKDISRDRPWTFYEYLEPLEVHYDGGISLRGLAWGQGAKQLSSQDPFALGQDEQAMWVVLRWQSAPGLEVEYSISLRLHNDEGGAVFQQDAVLRNPDTASTVHWSAGESVDTLHYLKLPADLVPGEYEMRLVVYDFATLKPTVEVGVWEPETVLARLLLEEAR